MTDGPLKRPTRRASEAGPGSRATPGSRVSGDAGTTLAPLAFLQNQRRGSITVLSDPSLHAAPAGAGYNVASPSRTHAQPDISPSGRLLDSSQRVHTHIPLNRTTNPPQGSHAAGGLGPPLPPIDRTENPVPMTSDSHANLTSLGHDGRTNPPILPPPTPSDSSLSPSLYTPSGSHGTKRKMSIENVSFPHSGVDIDPQLVGPGSGMNIDSADGPSLKRRGSVAATQNMAHLSLHDRRNSLDSRTVGMSPGGSQWWGNERRDSNASSPGVFPGQYPSGFPADSPHGRPPGGMATFAWPAGPPPGAPLMPGGEMDPHMQGQPFRPFDTSAPPTMPPVTFTHDRRMSAPGIMSSPTMAAASGSGRTLRSRSRPESRAGEPSSSASFDHEAPLSAAHSAGDGNESASSSGMPPPFKPASASAPYSRSPELRVSHKMAERKRRKEMKDLFDELRDHLPADRGMKASKWEILSKAVEFITQMKQTHQEMSREIEMLRHELDATRQGMSFVPGGPSHPGVPSFPPHMMGYPGAMSSHIPPSHSGGSGSSTGMHPPPPPQQRPPSRPSSTDAGGFLPSTNGGMHGPDDLKSG